MRWDCLSWHKFFHWRSIQYLIKNLWDETRVIQVKNEGLENRSKVLRKCNVDSKDQKVPLDLCRKMSHLVKKIKKTWKIMISKIVIFKTSKRDFSGTTQLITIQKTVLKLWKRALSFEILKSRNLIGRKFLKFFSKFLIWILLKSIGYFRFSLSQISLTRITLVETVWVGRFFVPTRTSSSRVIYTKLTLA